MNETAKQYRVLVVDDHPIVRRGFAQLINQEPDITVCAEAEDIAEAVTALEACHPDLVIVDIVLKNANGLELLKRLPSLAPETKALVVSMHDEQIYAERVLRAGARGYVMKQEADEVIVTAIRRVLQGGIYVSDQVNERILMNFAQNQARFEASPVEFLTDRELEVFELIGQGISTRQIGERLSISIKTVETYRARIKEKLRLESGAELVQTSVEWAIKKSLT
ncbi:MAG TPA: response regulator transcription factor [Candidatus Hydrogenedentes bacterium]|jgi:DNA-binding NarL/FixJ family response regulator|nr:response regulator transcription factor [Candidatus Hydrogenedentota bacterium]MDY0030947.1 response regulator transcription factor [FCB group bacterium]NLT61587.1 response regulator transcription factor [Candidatus Hydrogenedentota bacterium]HNV20160.1 response regulator transcription factor [Candidatus Hydrogenedentota bacterium]HNZ17738.1 response regulator transcription factor [Candidatus Hydrogenedentota bacterium]